MKARQNRKVADRVAHDESAQVGQHGKRLEVGNRRYGVDPTSLHKSWPAHVLAQDTIGGTMFERAAADRVVIYRTATAFCGCRKSASNCPWRSSMRE
jgi:hypothetical protein